MSIQLFANNAKTTLAAAVNSTQTTISVAPGTGSLFPSPSSGQQFKITLVSAASSSVYEICNCTARSGDTLTVQRGQEGTTAQPFLLNDIAANFDTAGVMQNFVQTDVLQANSDLFAVAGGTANALTATFSSGLTSVPNGMTIWVDASYANTGAATLQVTLGSTIISAAPIVKGNNAALAAGDIPGAGYPLTLVYSSTYSAWVLSNPFVVFNLGAIYPVGSIYFNASNNTNPATLLGVGTWSAIGQGTVLVGYQSGDPLFGTVGNTGGSRDAVVVSHTHTAVVNDPGHNHQYQHAYNAQPQSGNTTPCFASTYTDNTSTATTGISVTNNTTGVAGTNGNLQPYLVVYMWVRTA